MARQIKTFKRKHRSVEALCPKEEIKEEAENKEETPISFYEATHNFIQKSWELGNPLDHKDILKNLLLVIADNKLLPGSNVYERICRLVREWMPIDMLKDVYLQSCTGTSIVWNIQIKDTLKYRVLSWILFWISLYV